MKVIVDNRVRLDLWGRAAPQVPSLWLIRPEVVTELEEAFAHENPVFKALTRGKNPTLGELPIIRTFEHKSGEISFPRGGYRRVKEILERAGYRPFADDRRVVAEDPTIPDHRPPPNYVVGGALWEHQEEAVQAAIAKQNCIVRAGTGSGKTTVGLALIGRIKQRTLVVVSARNLLDQWVERVAKELAIPEREVGVFGAGRKRIRPVTIAIQQALARGIDPELLEYFGAVIYDEVQEAAARTVFAAIDPWPAKYRVGLSADETRKDKKEFLIYDLFGSVAAEIGQTELIRRKVVVDVAIRVVPTAFSVPGYRQAMMSRNGFMRRNAVAKMAGLLASDPDRSELAKNLAKRAVGEGQQVFVFTDRVEHALEIDRALVADGIMSGTMVGGQEFLPAFRETKAGLRTKRLQVGVGTVKAIGKGTDFPAIGTGIIANPLASNKQLFGQVRGRVCRSSSGKEAGCLYYLWDRAIFGKKALENLASWYRGCVTVLGEDGEWVPVRDYLASLRKGALT